MVYFRDICFLVSWFGGEESSAIATGAVILKCCGAGTLPDELSGCAVSKQGREWIDGGWGMRDVLWDRWILSISYPSLCDHWLRRGEVRGCGQAGSRSAQVKPVRVGLGVMPRGLLRIRSSAQRGSQGCWRVNPAANAGDGQSIFLFGT